MTRPWKRESNTAVEKSPPVLPPVSGCSMLAEARLEPGVLLRWFGRARACACRDRAGAHLERDAILERAGVPSVLSRRPGSIRSSMEQVSCCIPTSACTVSRQRRSDGVAAASYLALEIDPENNQRGGRMDEISRLMRLLTGAEATWGQQQCRGAVADAGSAWSRAIGGRFPGEAVEIGVAFAFQTLSPRVAAF